MSAPRVISFVILAAILTAAIGAWRWGFPLRAQTSAGVDALQTAKVLERLIERTAPRSRTGAAPGFVLDPAWPKVLPHNWVMGDVGGIHVDSHDRIWVYHRPRALTTTDSGVQGVGARTRKANRSARWDSPVTRARVVLRSGPVSVAVRQRGKSVAGLGWPCRSRLSRDEMPGDGRMLLAGREHGIFVDHNDFVWVAGNGEIDRGTNSGEYPWAANFGGDDSQILKFKPDGTFIFAIGRHGVRKPNSNDTNGGTNGTPQPYLPADFTVDPETNVLYIADGYGNRRVLMVDAATGKYIGHFGAYGQNPVIGESTDPAYGGAWAANFKKGQLKPKFFRSPLHGVKMSGDGLLYVADRGNNRVQVFRTAEVGKPCANPDGDTGKCGFVREILVAPQTIGGTSGSIALSRDPKQTCLYVAA